MRTRTPSEDGAEVDWISFGKVPQSCSDGCRQVGVRTSIAVFHFMQQCLPKV